MKSLRLLLPAILVAALFLAAQLALPDARNALRERTFDFYQTLMPRTVALDQVAIVAIDEAALAKVGRWPWPREKLGDLVNLISRSGAAAIGVDLLFPEPDNSAAGPQSDAAFAEALRTSPSVLAMSLTDEGAKLTAESKTGFSFIGDGSLPATRGYRGGVAPIEPLAIATKGLGIVRSFADDDGRMRAIPLIWAEEPGPGVFRYWPAMSVELLRVAQGEEAMTVRLFGSDDDALKVGQVIVPLADGRLRLIDTPTSPLRVSAATLLDEGAQEQLQDRIIILAVDAVGLDRYHLTARGDLRLGADLHAIAVSQMLTGDYLTPVADARTKELGLFGALAALMIGVFLWLGRKPVLAAFAIAGIVALPLGIAAWFYAGKDQLIDGGQPALGLLFVAIAGGYALYREAEHRRVSLQKQFSQFLSPDVVQSLADTDAMAALAVEDREITVMLLDVRGYTAMSEKYGAHRMVDVINHFFAIASDEIFKRSGTIDKYMGDAVLAFWNAPLDQPDHASRAVDCAQAILDRVARENKTLTARDLPGIRIVSVLETGVCSVGNMGTPERIDYTAIGPTVNLVSRLEKYAKDEGHLLVTGPNCAARLNRPMLKVANVEVRGFAEPVAVYVP